MARSEQSSRRSVIAVAVLVLVTCTQAREFRQRRNNGAVDNVTDALIIPDTANIDSSLLKAVSADKFLSLWFIFVLAGPTKHTDRPWTLLVPLNTGLPGPGVAGFLTDKDATKTLLLNHVLVGTALSPKDLLTEVDYTTQGGTPLLFTRDRGETYVNGIKLIGDPISVAGGMVFVIENFLPVHSDTNEVLADAPVKPELSVTPDAPVIPTTTAQVAAPPPSTTIEKAPEPEEITKFTPKRRLSERERPFPFRKNPRVGDQITSDKNAKASSTAGFSETSARVTRFDKFRNRNKENSELKETVVKQTTETVLGSFSSTSASVPIESIMTQSPNNEDTTDSELLVENTIQPDSVEDTATVSPSSVPDVFAAFANAINFQSAPEEPSTPTSFVVARTELFEPDTETPFLAFEKFVKTTINGEQFFAESDIEPENFTTTEINAPLISDKTVAIKINSETEFLPESDFVPFNDFLNSQTATEKFSEAFDMIPDEEGAEADHTSKWDGVSSNDTNGSSFLNWLKREVTSRHQLGGKEFLHHLLESGVAEEFTSRQQYTALIPTDEAFYAYYPIDWGFNPFLVESFLRRTLKEHLLEGDVALETLPDGEQLRTLAGTTLTVQRTDGGVMVAGVRVLTESEVVSPYGRIYAVPRLLHVTDQTVKLLREMHPHLERAPLLGSPWPMSQFLSHLLQRTEHSQSGSDGRRDATTFFAKYLALSHLSHLAPSSDEDFNHLEYTALVPTDESIMATLEAHRQSLENSDGAVIRDCEGEAADPFLDDDDEARNRLVGGHILKGRHSLSSLRPGMTVTTLLNDTLTVTATNDGGVMVGGEELVPPGESLYNLGAMFVVRGPLRTGTTDSAHGQASARPLVPTVSQPRVVTRTEVSVSRRVNDGALETVPAPVADMLVRRQRRQQQGRLESSTEEVAYLLGPGQ